MILQCKYLKKQFGNLAAIDNLSFGVAEGEIFGIAGPNGAGKTTLFNMITGVYNYSGEIIFDNDNISRLRTHRICQKGIARTFQIPQLFHTLPVIDNIRIGAYFGTRANKKKQQLIIEDVLSFTDLCTRRNDLAANLNLWDKKMTMIAAAIATCPRILLLDEPMSGLNPNEVQHAVDIIERINREMGLTIIIIEHFMKVLSNLSKRLMILENGTRICLDSPKNVSCNRKVIECYLGDSNA